MHQAVEHLQRTRDAVWIVDAGRLRDVPNTAIASVAGLLLSTRQTVADLMRADSTPQLRWMHSLSAGVDTLPFELLQQRRMTTPLAVTHLTHHQELSFAALAEFCMGAYLLQ